MHQNRLVSLTLVALIVPGLLLVAPPTTQADHIGQDLQTLWRDYSDLLERHVALGRRHGVSLTLVDYPALRRDPAFARVVEGLARFDPGRLTTRRQRLAFYINAYNILAMRTVADHWPVESIKDVGNLFSPVWGRTAGVIGGHEVTLDGIENAILRRLGEPRIHFAIVCASVSCPDLRREPYYAGKLDQQLDDQVRRFLANPGKGLRRQDHDLRVSRIFDWFEDDFKQAGGVLAFIRRYRSDLPADGGIDFLDYDWSVNVLQGVEDD